MDQDWPGMAGSHDVWKIEQGDPESGVILHVPHASRNIPEAELGRFRLDDAGLEAELDAITDADTDLLARTAAERANRRPWVFLNRNSRLLMDPERFPDDREEMLKVGMGPIYQRTINQEILRTPDPDDDQRLMDHYYWPYARAFEQLVGDRLERLGRVLIIDVHSYPLEPLPYELHADQARPELCIGTNRVHTPPELVEVAKAAWPGSTELDQPFSGCYVPERFYGTDNRVQALMLEIRRDVMADWVSRKPARRNVAPIIDTTVAVIDGAN